MIKHLRQLASVSLLLVSLMACSPRQDTAVSPSAEMQRTLLVGIDGGDWSFLLPLTKIGRAPVIERLSRDGFRSGLHSPTMASPVEWTTIVTGKSSDKHGITSWTKPKPGARKQFTVITRKSRTATTLWNILSDNGIDVGIVGWWATWPAEKVRGTLITDAFIYRDSLSNTVFPSAEESLFASLEPLATERYHTLLQKLKLPVDSAQHSEASDAMESDIRWQSGQIETLYRQVNFDCIKHEAARVIMREHSPRFMAVYYRASDLASHFFYLDSARGYEAESGWPSRELNIRKYSNVIPGLYEECDTFLGELVATYETRPDIVVVSDHGFGEGAYYREFKPRRFFKASGLMVAGHPITEVIADVSTGSVPDTFTVTFSSMTKGKSTVEIDENSLIDQFRAIVTQSGIPFFHHVAFQDNRGDGKRSLTIQLTSEISLTDRVQLPSGEQPCYTFFRYSKFSGSHRPRGIALFNGPDFVPGTPLARDPETTDICPVILRLFGLPRAEDMDGSISERLFNDDFRRRCPEQPEIPSYEKKSDHLEEIPDIEPETNNKILEELKSIGYI